MVIKVISQSTAERQAETRELFEQCKPYLDDGYSLAGAVKLVTRVNHQSFCRRKWYMDLREYAESMGYRGRV